MAICTFSCRVSFLYQQRFNPMTRKNELIFFLDFDQSIKDMRKHNFTSMVLSEYQNGVCKEKKLDPEDVLCARLTISGSFTTVEKSNPIYNSALKEFSEKHPFAKEWINMGTPDWHLKQMNISP